MLLGKRPRPPMKRTTSMTQITFDLNGNGEAPPPSDPHNPFLNGPQPFGPGYGGVTPMQGSCGVDGFDQRLLASVSPRTINRRHSGDFMDTHNHFLRSCALCKRRLVPGHDIYMYRGDSAFCSLECRQQQMNQDDRKEKCSLASKKDVIASSNATRSKVSAKGETVAAAV